MVVPHAEADPQEEIELRATRRLIAGATCALLVAACGGGGGENEGRYDGAEAEVAKVVDQLQSAGRESDGDRICEDLFTENLSISVQRASKRPCPEEVTSNISGEDTTFEVSDIKINGKNATAELVDEKDRRSSVLFQQEGGEWRIARIGEAEGAS